MIGKTIHEVGHAGRNTFFIRTEDNETHVFSAPLGGGWTRKYHGWGNPVARKETVYNTTYFIDETGEPIIGFIAVGRVDL